MARNGGYLHPPPGYLDVIPDTTGDVKAESSIQNEESDTVYPSWQGSVQAFRNDQIPNYRPRVDNGYLNPQRQRFSRIDNPGYQAARPTFCSGYLEPTPNL